MLGYYIVLFVILLAFEYAYYLLAKKLWIVDRPHHQSSHRGIVVRGGGIVFYVAYLLWSIVNGFSWYGGLIGLTILVIISFIDDIHDVSPKIRLICQFIAIVLMFYHSGLIRTNPHVILILSIACVGTVNIFNFMDGINGMTGGYSLVVTLALLYVDRNLIHFCDSSLLVFMILSLVVFNLFNFRRQAKCFAGDVGALAIGFILVYLVLRLCLRGQSMSWIAMSSVYLVDGGMTILHRILLRENLIKPHKEHAYQIMANELKMPHLVVSGIYMGLQAICCAVYIAWPGYPAFFAIFGVLIVMYLAFMKKYYHLHVEN
jgi:UDP-N-acetylmuramyl pentapeptide phosphotransferase/UDP-N-acetylglucosamine-1-phosphate transferase